MLVIVIPMLVSVLGLLAYALATNVKAVEAGRLLFFAGALVTLFVVGGHEVRLP